MINIRKELIFTAEMRPLVTERLDLVPVGEVPRVEVRMRNARHRLHPKLTATDLWTYDGHFPGKIFFVRSDQTIAVEWINEIDGTLPFSVVESGYAPIDPTHSSGERARGVRWRSRTGRRPIRLQTGPRRHGT